MRVTLKAVNDELAKIPTGARLAKGSRYFYFQEGEAADWLDNTVNVPTISSLSLEQWLQEFKRKKELNRAMLGERTVKRGKASRGSVVESKRVS